MSERRHTSFASIAIPPLMAAALLVPGGRAGAKDLEPVAVEGQPLAANADRAIRALGYLGAPLPDDALARLSSSWSASTPRNG